MKARNSASGAATLIHCRFRFPLALACTVASALASAETKIVPSVTASTYWTSNLELESEANSGLAFEIMPSVSLVHSSAALQANLNYEYRYVNYSTDLDRQQAYHTANAIADLAVVPDWIILGGTLQYTQAMIDPADAAVYGAGLFGAVNIADAFGYRIAPRIDHTDDWGRVFVEYSHGESSYDVDSLEGTIDTTLTSNLTLGSPEGPRAIGVNYVSQTSEFDISGRYRYEAGWLEAGQRVLGDLRLLVQGGQETNLFLSQSDGGFDETFWRAGFEWRSSRDDQIRITAGERFFGSTFEASWDRRARALAMSLKYTEGPSTQSRGLDLVSRDFAASATRSATTEFGREYGRITADAFISKAFTGVISLTGRITTVSLLASYDTRDFLVVPGQDEIIRFGATLSRRLGPGLSGALSVTRDDWSLRDGGSYRETGYTLDLSRQFGRSLTTSARLTVLDSDSYSSEILMLRVRKDFLR